MRGIQGISPGIDSKHLLPTLITQSIAHEKQSIFFVICLLAAVVILVATRQQQAGLKQDNNPTAVLAPTNSDILDVGPVTVEVQYSSPNPVKYQEQISQIKRGFTSAQFNRSFEQGRFLISTNRLADGSYRLVIVDKTAGTFCLRDQSGKNIWAKSLGMKDLGGRNGMAGMGAASNMIGITLNVGKSYFYDLESGEFIWMVGDRHWQ